jgi:hypothetical protein
VPVRRHAEHHDLRGLGVHDHIAWAFDGHERFLSAVVPFLRDGLELGQQLLYVVDEPDPAGLAGLGDVAQLEAKGALRIAATADVYGQVGHLSIDDQLATFAAAIAEAEVDGFDGIRVAADNSALAADPEAYRRWLEWEHTADAFILQHRVTGLCAFDQQRLSRLVLADLAALHPVLVDCEQLPPFRMFGDDGALAIIGECDTFSAEQLYRLLDAAPRQGELVVDLSATTFVNHRALLALSQLGRDGDRRVTVRNPPAVAQRVWDLLDRPSGSLRFESHDHLVEPG